jgi:hypothetical protein
VQNNKISLSDTNVYILLEMAACHVEHQKNIIGCSFPRRAGPTAGTALFDPRSKGLRRRTEMPCSCTAPICKKFGLRLENTLEAVFSEVCKEFAKDKKTVIKDEAH